MGDPVDEFTMFDIETPQQKQLKFENSYTEYICKKLSIVAPTMQDLNEIISGVSFAACHQTKTVHPFNVFKNPTKFSMWDSLTDLEEIYPTRVPIAFWNTGAVGVWSIRIDSDFTFDKGDKVLLGSVYDRVFVVEKFKKFMDKIAN